MPFLALFFILLSHLGPRDRGQHESINESSCSGRKPESEAQRDN
jgi:hypothetical protein